MDSGVTVIRAQRVITPGGEQPAAVWIRDGRILSVAAIDDRRLAGHEVVLPHDQVLMPGLVDTHVHLQDPGHTNWENFDSGTRAAARGGITTLVDMPLDSLPITVSAGALEQKVCAATGRIHVDVGFWGGLTPWNLDELQDMHDAGVFGFKCFLANTGLPEFPPVSPEVLRQALTRVAGLDSPLLVHAEHGPALDAITVVAGRDYATFLQARPASIEATAVATVLEAVRITSGRAHLVHISSTAGAERVADARAEGLSVTAETCPHYLSLLDTDVADGDTTFKVCPPIRDAENREALWRHLAAGNLDMIASDHSPSPVEEKHLDTGDFDKAFGGISSLQLTLPVVWTEARRRGYSLAQVANWMATRPAQVAGLARKGAIEPGRDADFCIFAPDASFVVRAEELYHRQPFTPYDGRLLDGVVAQTWLAGSAIDLNHPCGRTLHRADQKEVLPCASL